jgi:protease I
MKTVLLIVAFKGYQPVEYGHTREVLEKAGIKVAVGSTELGTAQAAPSKKHAQVCDDPGCTKTAAQYPAYEQVKVDVSIDAIKPENYDGIFLIGGPGALEYLDNPVVYGVMQKSTQLSKVIGAICISPRILAKAGLLQGKKATGWDDDGELRGVFKKNSVARVNKPVVVDGNIITADGPRAAAEFGQAIANKLLEKN